MLFLTAVLLVQPTPGSPLPNAHLTAGQIYEGCARYAALTTVQTQLEDRDEETCSGLIAFWQIRADADAAALAAAVGRDERIACPPENVRTGDGTAMAQVFVAYVDAHPEVRSEYPGVVLDRAMTDKWPCLHQAGLIPPDSAATR